MVHQVILSSFKEKVFHCSSKNLVSPEASGAANAPATSDSAMLPLQVPRMLGSEHSFPSPSSERIAMTNGFHDHVTPTISNGFSNNISTAVTSGNGIPNFYDHDHGIPNGNVTNGFHDHVTPTISNGFSNNISSAVTNGNVIPDFYALAQSMYSTFLNGSTFPFK